MHSHERAVNLLGVVALAAVERAQRATESVIGTGGAAAAALVHLHHRPSETVGALGRVLGLTQPGAVRLVDRLVELGLATRSSTGPTGDGRLVRLELTPAGQDRVAAVLPARAAALRQVLAGLDAAEVDRLVPLLERLVVALPPQAGPEQVGTDATVLHLCRLCDWRACRQGPGCPIETAHR